MKKQFIFLGLIFLALASVPTIIFLNKPQEIRSRASAATILSFSPSSTSSQPIQKKIGDPLALDVMINPGTNAISILKLEIQFDPNKFQPGSNPLVVNPAAFSTIVEGPVIDANNGLIIVTLSVGTDPTRAIRTLTKIASVNLIATAQSDNTPTIISFGQQSQAFSVAATDQSSQNVLATAMPDYIFISQGPTPTPGLGQITPTDTPFPTPTTIPTDTAFSFTVFLHGIWNSGDSTNPTGTSLSNKNPQNTQRELDVFVFNSSGQEIVNTSGNMDYDSARGNFTGTVDLGSTLPAGSYIVKIQSPSYLRKSVSGIQNITSTSNILTLPATTLVVGDINGDNTLNVIDYNILLGCYSDILPATFCPSSNQVLSDLNDDSAVNQFDYNLFLREITVQHGD